jgi:uncharacterized protein with von Willebrand factor type A (vWA) domain
MRPEDSGQLAVSIVEFCRFVRTHGLADDLRRTLTALEAAKTVDAANRQTLFFTLQSALCSTKEDWELFPSLFHGFWDESQSGPRSPAGERNQPSKRENACGQKTDSISFLAESSVTAAPDGDAIAVYGASAEHRLKRVDFSELPHDDLAQFEELSLRLLRRMSLRISRRFISNDRGRRTDLRRTLRRSISHGGEPIVLAYKRRKPRKNRLVILLDISGSMNLYSLFLIRFAYALQTCFRRVDTFLFSTSLVEISPLLRTRHLSGALRRLSQREAGWSGGTKIGESLEQFNQRHGELLNRDTLFMILSDGWDTGEPELLASQMRRAKQKAQKVLWLNPLLGLKDYQPLTRGMTAALPYVDFFAPANNLESLLALERYL